jgi:hypothetical protein
MTATNPRFLTAVAVPYLECGSTAETVRKDRDVLDKTDGVCCSRSFGPCWFCGSVATQPFLGGPRVFCCRGCAAHYAE